MRMAFECPECRADIQAEASESGTIKTCPQCKADIKIPAFKFGPGTIVGGYRLLELIAKGSSGQVFKAWHDSMNRSVALKILTPAQPDDQEHLRRFLNEVQLTARLEHPNIVTAYGAGVDQGAHYMAMTYVAGESLDKKLEREGPMEEREALHIARKIAMALDYAWREHKLLHRDVKPANILLDQEGEPLLTDLGLSKSLSDARSATLGASALGTPNYMSPEQVRGDATLDCRADIYSLGATLYHMLTGAMPFKETGIYETLRKQVQQGLPSPRTLNPHLSDGSERLLEIMLAKDRDARHANWKALIEDIDRVLSNHLPSRRFSRRVRQNMLAGLAALTVCAILAASRLHRKQTLDMPPPTAQSEPAAAPSPAPPAPVSLKERMDAIQTIYPQQDITGFFTETDNGLTVNLTTLPEFSDLKLLAGLRIVDLDLTGTKVSDLAPLSNMPLRRLILSETAVSNLAPLAGMRLTEIHLASTAVKDISVLKDMPLGGGISLARTKVSDLRPLTGLPFHWVNLWETPVVDLTPLRDMPLDTLDLTSTAVSDLEPLKGMRLIELKLFGCANVSDLSALKDMPLKLLVLERCDQVSDINVLGTLTQLRDLRLDKRLSALLWSSFMDACARSVQAGTVYAEQFKDVPALSKYYQDMQNHLATIRRKEVSAGQ